MTVELKSRAAPRITTRDLEILDFVARLGVVSAAAAAHWAGTGHSVTYRREARWRNAGLIRILPPVGNSGRLLACTRDGLAVVGRQALRPAQVSLGGLPHAVTVGLVAADLEREGSAVLSEREASAIEAREGRRLYSAQLPDGRFHRADLLVREGPIAIEVELSQKTNWRLDSIMRSWRRAIGRNAVDGVRYLCGEKALGPVERALKRTRTDELIEVEALAIPEVTSAWSLT